MLEAVPLTERVEKPFRTERSASPNLRRIQPRTCGNLRFFRFEHFSELPVGGGLANKFACFLGFGGEELYGGIFAH